MNRRATATQTAILELLRQDRRAFSHDTLTERLDLPANRVTVYRILNRFVEQRLVHRIVADDGRQYFASCEADCQHDAASHRHLHFRCNRCARVECLPAAPLQYTLPEGYRVEHHNVILSGTCAACG